MCVLLWQHTGSITLSLCLPPAPLTLELDFSSPSICPPCMSHSKFPSIIEDYVFVDPSVCQSACPLQYPPPWPLANTTTIPPSHALACCSDQLTVAVTLAARARKTVVGQAMKRLVAGLGAITPAIIRDADRTILQQLLDNVHHNKNKARFLQVGARGVSGFGL